MDSNENPFSFPTWSFLLYWIVIFQNQMSCYLKTRTVFVLQKLNFKVNFFQFFNKTVQQFHTQFHFSRKGLKLNWISVNRCKTLILMEIDTVYVLWWLRRKEIARGNWISMFTKAPVFDLPIWFRTENVWTSYTSSILSIIYFQ